MLIAFAASSSCRFFRRDQAPTPQPVPITPAPARQPEPQPASVPPKPAVSRPLTAAEKGIGPDGIPLYLARGYTPNERALLLGAFGIEAPQRMYLSDSSDAAILKYDVRLKQCRACYVDTYRVGFLSMRHPDETWERFEARIRQPASKPAAAAHGKGETVAIANPVPLPAPRPVIEPVREQRKRVHRRSSQQ